MLISDRDYLINFLLGSAYTLGFLEGALMGYPSAQDVIDAKAQCREYLEALFQDIAEEVDEFNIEQIIEVLTNNIGTF